MSACPSQFILIAVAEQDSIEREEPCTPTSQKQSPSSRSPMPGEPPTTTGLPRRSPEPVVVEAYRDTLHMRARMTSSRFVGRVGELAELERASRDAAEQRPVVVLLGGESGVGKTRLVREFEQRVAEEHGALFLRGEAVEQARGELPYAPLIGALRPLVRSHDPALETLGRGARAQ